MYYDYIITGCGLGGLSFAYHLLDQKPTASVLLLDRDLKSANDRTWSFWTNENPPYPNLIYKTWSQLGFAYDDYEAYKPILPYQYHTIRGIDFYDFMKQQLLAYPHVHFEQCEIFGIHDLGKCVKVKTTSGDYSGHKVIDSQTKPSIDSSATLNYQNFVGWRVQTEKSIFQKDRAMLMDFRVKQLGAGSFIYLLPYSETEALVEFTQFDTQKYIDEDAFELGIADYLKSHYQLDDYAIVSKEVGAIPMTDHQFNDQPSKNVYRIGTVGGDTKATTGYTFTNVQQHAKEIIKRLDGQKMQDRPERFAFYDKLLLQIMSNAEIDVDAIFYALFKHQPYPRILKFLEEKTSPFEEVLIFSQMKWSPFLKAVLQQKKKYELATH